MNYIDDWSLYNQKNKLNAKDYVSSNLFRLVSLFKFDDECSDEEKEQLLVDYFTKYPDQIKSLSYYTVGKPNQMSVPRLMNIGGVIKYR